MTDFQYDTAKFTIKCSIPDMLFIKTMGCTNIKFLADTGHKRFLNRPLMIFSFE